MFQFSCLWCAHDLCTMVVRLMRIALFSVAVLLLSGACILVPNRVDAFSSDLYTRVITFFFPETPEMLAIARCESGLRHVDALGNVLRGGLGGHMIGLFQLHETYHRAPARAQGYDINTLFGNVAYARELYRAQSLTPWNSSRECWLKEENVDTYAFASSTPVIQVTLAHTLRLGDRGDEVLSVQERLRLAGYTQELLTAKRGVFDIPTGIALMHFQCREGIACVRVGPFEGLGVTNSATREALMKMGKGVDV